MELELTVKNVRNLTKTTDNAMNMIAPVNNFAHCLFKQINKRLNGTLISNQTDTFHYKAYLQALSNYNRQEGETISNSYGLYNAIDFKIFTVTDIVRGTADQQHQRSKDLS